MTPPYRFISFTALLLTSGTRERPPQSGSVQTGFGDMYHRRSPQQRNGPERDFGTTAGSLIYGWGVSRQLDAEQPNFKIVRDPSTIRAITIPERADYLSALITAEDSCGAAEPEIAVRNVKHRTPGTR